MDAHAPVAERFGLGVPDQISFAVASVDEAVPRYERIFGPFDVIDVTLPEASIHGRDTSVTLRLAFGHCGPLEIELVEVCDGDGHPMREFLAEKGEGIHHVRFPVADPRATQAAMEAAGFVETFAGDGGTVRFAYLECPGILGGTSIELIGPSA